MTRYRVQDFFPAPPPPVDVPAKVYRYTSSDGFAATFWYDEERSYPCLCGLGFTFRRNSQIQTFYIEHNGHPFPLLGGDMWIERCRAAGQDPRITWQRWALEVGACRPAGAA